MTGDMINGIFELLGAIAILTSVRSIIKDKCYAGVSPINTVFFASWGVWNMFFYPSIGQHYSFLGGCALAFANLVYLFCLWWYPHRI